MKNVYDQYCFKHQDNYLKDYCPDCRIRELEAKVEQLQKDFDKLLIRDTKNLQRLIDSQAKVEQLKKAAAYACAEFNEDWQEARVSIDSKTAHDALARLIQETPGGG